MRKSQFKTSFIAPIVSILLIVGFAGYFAYSQSVLTRTITFGNVETLNLTVEASEADAFGAFITSGTDLTDLQISNDLIVDGETTLTGTTTIELAKLLGSKRNLTIITNDLEIALVLEEFDSHQIIVMGGLLRNNLHCIVGNQAIQQLDGFNVDKVFIATNGLSLEKGATTPDIQQAEIKKKMISIASKVIMLCDSSKFKIDLFVQFAGIEDINILVTDFINESLAKAFLEEGIEIISLNKMK